MGRWAASLLGTVVLVMMLGAPAHSAPLGLLLQPGPDISTGFIGTSYDAGTDLLSMSGFASELDDDGDDVGNHQIFFDAGENTAFGDWVLNAQIDGSGNLVSGTISITGWMSSFLGGGGTGTLLTGSLTAFGFDAGSPAAAFEFLFNVTGGDLAGLYGSSGGIIMTGHGFAGSFNGSFSGTSGVSNTGVPLPEPSALLLLGLSATLFVVRQRGRVATA